MTRRAVSRREALKYVASTAAAVAAAPYFNLNRYRLFASSATEYSARAIRLVHESDVLDMLGLLSLGPNQDKWMRNPDSFGEAELREFRESGINVFHTATGTGGPDV